MAASSIARPGTNHGPCLPGACKHRDCAQMHALASTPCPLCSKPIGYETPFYDDRSNHGLGLVHAVCLEVQVERERAAKPDQGAQPWPFPPFTPGARS